MRRLLQVDQKLHEALGPGIAIRIADPTGTLAVWQQQVSPERGTRCGTDRIETIVEDAFEVFEVHAERYLTSR